MGSRRFAELTGMRRPGHSHPIGRAERRRQSTATESFLNSAFDVVFGDEIEIEEEFGWRQLPPEGEGETDSRVWVGFEIQTRDRSFRNSTIVVASYPYSTDWFDWGDFKPILRRGRDERFQPLRAPQERIKELFRHRSELSTENLDTRPGYLTARLSLPTRTQGLAITARGRSAERSIWTTVETSLNRKRGGKYLSDLWCFGVCREFAKCCEVLRGSPQAKRLLELTGDGTLFEDRPLKTGMPALQIGPTARSLKENVLESSIIKALAGSSPKLDKIRDSGRPPQPTLLMEWIYTETMYSLAQRLRGEPEAGGRVRPKNFMALAVTSMPRAASSFDDKVENFCAALREQGITEEFRNLIVSWLSDTDEEERIVACAALMGAMKAGYRVQSVFEPLLRRIIDDPADSATVRQAACRVMYIMRVDRQPVD